jgi:hypothetical protein
MEMDRSKLWLVPAWLAAAAAVQSLATVRSVYLVIRSLETMTSGGGGVAAISAALWEALLPLLAGGYIGIAVTLIAIGLVIRNIGADSDSTQEWAGTSVALSAVVALFSLAAIVSTAILFRRVVRLIVNVIDPQAKQPLGIAEISSAISRGLITTAAASVIATVLLGGAVFVILARKPKGKPSLSWAAGLTLLCVLTLGALIADVASVHAERVRLEHTAMTGEVQQ